MFAGVWIITVLVTWFSWGPGWRTQPHEFEFAVLTYTQEDCEDAKANIEHWGGRVARVFGRLLGAGVQVSDCERLEDILP